MDMPKYVAFRSCPSTTSGLESEGEAGDEHSVAGAPSSSSAELTQDVDTQSCVARALLNFSYADGTDDLRAERARALQLFRR